MHVHRLFFFLGFAAVALAWWVWRPAPAAAAPYPDTADRLWPGGVVPFEYGPDVTDPDQMAVVEAAMAVWEEVANVVFIPRTDEEDYLLVEQGTYGPAYPPPVGYEAGSGPHSLFLNGFYTPDGSSSICTNVYGMVHEVGHALGFAHTHQRTDRDLYVAVDFDLISIGTADWQILNNTLAWPRTAMDVDSIMTYPLCTASIFGADCWDDIPNRAPIVLLEPYASQWAGMMVPPDNWTDQCDPADANFVGQRNHLSRNDAFLMSFLYPEANWRFVEQAYGGETATGSFYEPYITVTDGVSATAAGGTVWVQPGTYAGAGLYDVAMTIQAPLGGVILE